MPMQPTTAPQTRPLANFNGFRTPTRTIKIVSPSAGPLVPRFAAAAVILGEISKDGVEYAHVDPVLVAGNTVFYVERVDVGFFEDSPESEPIVEWLAKTDQERAADADAHARRAHIAAMESGLA